MYYNCNICNKSFVTKRNYTRHINNMNIHNKYKEDLFCYKCICGKQYIHRSNLSKHKNTCNHINVETKNIDYNDVDKETLIQLLLKKEEEFEIERGQHQKEKEELQKQVEHEKQNKTIGTQNNNLNIQINAFGCENLEYITDKFKIKCLKQIYKSIPEMVAKIHFNTKY